MSELKNNNAFNYNDVLNNIPINNLHNLNMMALNGSNLNINSINPNNNNLNSNLNVLNGNVNNMMQNG